MKKLLILSCLLFISLPLYALDFSNLITMTRSLIRDVNPSSGYPVFSDALIGQYINIIHREMAVNVWCIEDSHTYTISGWQREFQFTDDMVAINRLTVDGTLVEEISVSKLDDNESWEANLATTTPSNYYIRHTTISVIGFDTILSTANVSSFTVWYIKNPTQLSASTDLPFDGQARLEPFNYAIVLGASALISYAYGKPTDGDRYYNMYVDRIKTMEQVIRLSPNYFPSINSSTKK